MTRYNLEKRILHGGDYNPDQWLDYPNILQNDLRMMSNASANTFSLGIFAWSSLEPTEGKFTFEWLDNIMDNVYSIGGNVILATPSGARPSWMSEKYPEVLRTNSKREKMLHGGRHNHCFSSLIYREKVRIINKKLVDRYANHPALLMWHISNEYSGDCHCDMCQENFRDWLKKKYTTIQALNDAWWGPFWSHTFNDWSQVESPSPLGERMVHGLNLDWKRFVTDQTIDFYKNEIVDIRKETPMIPITTNFMADTQDLIPFQSLDYSKFANYVDVLSWDCYPAWHNDWGSTADLASKVGFINDFYRSLKQQPFLIMESTPSAVNWHDVNKAKRPGMHMLSSLQLISHGSDSNLYFQWRKSRGSSEKFHGAVIDHDNDENNRVYKDVKEVGEVLEKISEVKGSYKKAKVAILFDWDNNWALLDCQGFSEQSKQYSQTLQNHYRYFWNHDIPVEVVTPSSNLDKYALIIAPMLYLITKETMERLEQYVKNGGYLVSSYLTGYVDENDLAYIGGWPKNLQDIFGINVKETDTLYPTDSQSISFNDKIFNAKDYCSIISTNSADELGIYLQEFYKGTTAISMNEYGLGKSYFIGARTDFDFLEEFYGLIVNTLSLNNQFVVRGNPEVSVQSRDFIDTDVSYQFVMNFSEKSQRIIVLSTTWDLKNGKYENTDIFLNPYEVKVLKVDNKEK